MTVECKNDADTKSTFDQVKEKVEGLGGRLLTRAELTIHMAGKDRGLFRGDLWIPTQEFQTATEEYEGKEG